MSKMYEATLVRGETYYLGSKRFERGKAVLVTPEEKAKLQRNAVDRVTVQESGGTSGEDRQKFTFKEVAAKAPVKGDKLADLEAMQGDGGVSFDEDDADGEEEGDTGDEEDQNDPPVTNAKPVAKAAGKAPAPARGRSR